MKKLIILLIALFLPIQAHATFLGHTLDADYLYPDDASVYNDMSNEVVGAGVEWNLFNIDLNADAFSITLSRSGIINFLSGSFNGWSFTDVLGTIDNITNVTVDASSTLLGFDNSRVSFTNDSVSLNFANLSDPNDFYARVNVEFDSAPVPEPATMLLFGTGLVGLVGSRLRKKKK